MALAFTALAIYVNCLETGTEPKQSLESLKKIDFFAENFVISPKPGNGETLNLGQPW